MNLSGVPIIFLSCVTKEFGRYRPLVATRLKRCSIGCVFQEEFEYTECDTITKLCDYLIHCDVVVHLVGRGAGFPAESKAVDEFLNFLQHDPQAPMRRQEFLRTAARFEVDEQRMRELTYTQWEALLALCFDKHFIPLKPSGVISDGHPKEPPFQETESDRSRQDRHLEWLKYVARKFPDEFGDAITQSYLEDLIDRINGFLHRLEGKWTVGSKQLAAIQQAQQRIGRESYGKLVRLLTHVHRDTLSMKDFLPAVAAQIAGDQFVTILFGDSVDQKGDLLTTCIERVVEYTCKASHGVCDGRERLILLALVARQWAQQLASDKAVTDLSDWIDEALTSINATSDAFQPQVNHILKVIQGGQLPVPILQASFGSAGPASDFVRRAARIVWGAATQNLDLGHEEVGDAQDTVSAVENAVYEQRLEDFPFLCIELSLPKTDQCFKRWYDDRQSESWARLLRIQRPRREWLHELRPLQMPLSKTYIACCSHPDFVRQATDRGIFLATWSESEPNWNSLVNAVGQCRIGIWFETRQTQQTTDSLLNELDGLFTYDAIVDCIRAWQKKHPGTRCLFEHPQHEPFSPKRQTELPQQQQNVLFLQ